MEHGNEIQNTDDSSSDLSVNESNSKVIVRRAKKKKKAPTRSYKVEVRKATVGLTSDNGKPLERKVAAYCRVSTDEEAQTSSYELQVDHYTKYINSKDGWVLIGIYADEGISGTQVKHREEFMRMIDDCKEGKIDLILTKSISRFSRNVVDCLSTIRDLKALNPPVEVYFEKENLSSLDDKTDMVLGLMSSIAQEESRSISANLSWAIRRRMENGTQKIPTACLLGYGNDEDGQLVIIEEEAKIVAYIYTNFVKGIHPKVIAERLNAKSMTTVLGNPWTSNSVRNILRNEKYCGDVLMQKTFTVDYLTHQTKKNEGERDQFFIPDHHEAIVSKEVWNKAQTILDKMNYRNWKQTSQQRLIPLAKGRLKGFISISHKWKEVSVTRLSAATCKLMAGESGLLVELVDNVEDKITVNESEEIYMSDVLNGFEVVDLEVGRSDSVMTVSGNMIKFNKPTATELSHPAFVRLLINTETKQVAIQECTEKTRNAIAFSKGEKLQTYAITVKVPAIVIAVRKLLPDLPSDEALTFTGKLFADDKVIIYDLNSGEPVKKRAKRKKEDELAENVEDIDNVIEDESADEKNGNDGAVEKKSRRK